VKTGWVAGFGMEYLLRPNVILNLGYQYVDLGTTSLTASSPDESLSVRLIMISFDFKLLRVAA
jgi:opacity protein-like surface antigen